MTSIIKVINKVLAPETHRQRNEPSSNNKRKTDAKTSLKQYQEHHESHRKEEKEKKKSFINMCLVPGSDSQDYER